MPKHLTSMTISGSVAQVLEAQLVSTIAEQTKTLAAAVTAAALLKSLLSSTANIAAVTLLNTAMIENGMDARLYGYG